MIHGLDVTCINAILANRFKRFESLEWIKILTTSYNKRRLKGNEIACGTTSGGGDLAS